MTKSKMRTPREVFWMVGGIAAALPALLGGCDQSGTVTTPVTEETKTLDELYNDALAEGGNLIIYAGGDTSTQQDFTKAAFLARFPDMKLTIVVDYSKFHDVRIDNQLATGTLVPDVVQLQTLQDFTRWDEEGRLLHYKPAGSSTIYPSFKDAEGAWTAVQVIGFSFVYDVAAAGNAPPTSPLGLVDPQWKGQIASSYPNDDDAVLYLYTLYAEKYGWDWISKLAAQDIRFARGSNTPSDAVTAAEKVIGIGTAGSLTADATSATKWVVADEHPFMAWGQRAAIFADAKHPAAAKLYMNWAVSVDVQMNSFNGWSVRTDVTPYEGLKPIWELPNANIDGFLAFMEDREQAERWRQTFSLYFGEVTGDPSPGWLGLHPGQ